MLTWHHVRTASPSHCAASVSRHIRFKPFSNLPGELVLAAQTQGLLFQQAYAPRTNGKVFI